MTGCGWGEAERDRGRDGIQGEERNERMREAERKGERGAKMGRHQTAVMR